MAKTKRGPSKLDLLALGGLLTLAVVLVLPRLVGLRMDHNEQDAIHAIGRLRDEVVRLRRDRASGFEASAEIPLRDLVGASRDGRKLLEDCALQSSPQGERLVRHGYVMRIDYGARAEAGAQPEDFTILAWPERYGETGAKMYKVDEDGQLFRARNLDRQYSRDREPPSMSRTSGAEPAPREGSRGSGPGASDEVEWEPLPRPEN